MQLIKNKSALKSKKTVIQRTYELFSYNSLSLKIKKKQFHIICKF